MSELEDISFKNRVLFYEDELLKLHATGKPFLRKTRQNKENWESVFYLRSGNLNNRGRRMFLTPRAIAVLTGMDNLGSIDDDHKGPISQLDMLDGLYRMC